MIQMYARASERVHHMDQLARRGLERHMIEEKRRPQRGTGFVLELPKEGETLTAAEGTEPPPPPGGFGARGCTYEMR